MLRTVKPISRNQTSLFGPLRKPKVAVLFAGWGGACKGIRDALGVDVHVAVNHDPHAIRLHKLNHSETFHYPEDVWNVVPKVAARGCKIKYMWLSPDCTHHSRAKGGKPKDSGRRSLANVVFRWIDDVRPEVIYGENVEEFKDWGPLDDEGNPIKALKGTLFRAWVERIRSYGYEIEWRTLRACDYGAPTTRERLYIVARCDGQPIRWPEPTHGPTRAKPWRTAAECIDFTLPACSIFATRKEAKAWAKAHKADGIPNRPLAEATERRIAEGLRRFVLQSDKPFLVNVDEAHQRAYVVQTGHQSNDGGKVRSVGDPVSTIVTKAEHCLATPVLVRFNGEHNGAAPRTADINEPLPTITTEPRFGIAAATLVQTGYGERQGQAPRTMDIEAPLSTVVATAQKHGMVAAHLTKFYGTSVGAEIDKPVPTITADGQHLAVVGAWLAKHYTGATGSSIDSPIGTVTAVDHHSLCTATLSPVQEAGALRVAAFLIKYYSASSGQVQGLDQPLDTITTKARFSLVTVMIQGQPYVITDITMRMLQPRELARANGFSDDYQLQGTKEQQVRMVGNAVVPIMAEVLVRANTPEYCQQAAAA